MRTACVGCVSNARGRTEDDPLGFVGRPKITPAAETAFNYSTPAWWNNAMQPIVRAAIETDMPAIMELLRLKAEFDGCQGAFKATSERLQEAFFSPIPRAHALLAEHEGIAIGIATYYPTYSTFLARPGIWLDDLYVREGNRSRGVGRAMMAALARLAKDSDCGRIEWTVALNNDRGIAFYEQHGASVRHLSRCVRLGDEALKQLASENL